MKKTLTLTLDEQTYERLLAACQGDEKALARRVEEIIEEQFAAPQNADQSLNADGLEDYLNKSTTGSRAYGVKGQGW